MIIDDIVKGDSGCVAIQQLYEDFATGQQRDKSAQNDLGSNRTLQQVDRMSFRAIDLSHTKYSSAVDKGLL